MYLVPKNVGGRFEFFEGFGIKELIFCALGALVGLGLTFVLSSFTGSAFAKIIPVPGVTALVFFTVREDPRIGKSILTNMLDQRKFLSKPRRYYYVFGDGRKSR